MRITEVVLGRRLSNSQQGTRQIGWFEAVPALGLDGLASASYGPEAALAILAPLGVASRHWVTPVMAVIVLLLVILYFSYRQTVVAYPTNGGGYTVAKENLGANASLLAAAAIMIDYILNVAVGISAGVGALISSLPALQPYTLVLCLGILVLVTLVNLRGTAEAGWLFALPTYVFIAGLIGLIIVGLWRMGVSAGHPAAVIAPPPLASPTESVSLWLLLRAFASGCTAMTGVEAVSNGVGSFKPPVTTQAHRTLTVICVTLALLLIGLAALTHAYALGAMDQTKTTYRSVLSQVVAAIAGRGTVYYVIMASVLAVLCLSANTSFVAFPRLCRLLAADGYLPRPFAVSDRRLVFSVGILFLSVTAGALLIGFGGITDRLIPLFAVGAFVTFTMSQIGMVVHWRREQPGDLRRVAINAAGALATLSALVIITAAKFLDGAWLTAAAFPALILLLRAFRRYYDRLDLILAADAPFEVAETGPPTILVALDARTRMTDRALQFAMTLSPDVIAVHLLRLEGPDGQEDARRLRRQWQAEVIEPLERRTVTPPRLVILPAPFREIHGPLLKFMERLDAETPGRAVAVLIPELVLTRSWERLLHSRRADQLRRALLRHGGPRLNIITAPWRREPVAREGNGHG